MEGRALDVGGEPDHPDAAGRMSVVNIWPRGVPPRSLHPVSAGSRSRFCSTSQSRWNPSAN